MITNFLRIAKFPSTLHTIELNLTYPEVIQLFKSKPIYFHLHRNKLYFIGDPELVKATLKKENAEISKIEIDSTFITNNWHIVRVLLYKIFRYFLYKRGFGSHIRFKNKVFMVREKRYRRVTFIYDYSNGSSPAFVHEGFNFFFRLYGGEIFLGIDPCVVVTRDGKNCISARDLPFNKYEEYKKSFIDKRFNSVIKRMFNTFVDLLCDENRKIVIRLYNDQVEIDGSVIKID